MSVTRDIQVMNAVGLHARPAATFVRQAQKFQSIVKVENLSTSSQSVNAKSLLSLLSIGVQRNHKIRIHADGADQDDALQTLVELIENRCGEAE